MDQSLPWMDSEKEREDTLSLGDDATEAIYSNLKVESLTSVANAREGGWFKNINFAFINVDSVVEIVCTQVPKLMGSGKSCRTHSINHSGPEAGMNSLQSWVNLASAVPKMFWGNSSLKEDFFQSFIELACL